MFWFGIQTFTGSECTYQVRLRCVLDSALTNQPHRPLPPSDDQSHLALIRKLPKPPPRLRKHNIRRPAILLPLLAGPTALPAHLTAKDPLALPRQIPHRPTDVLGNDDLGICEDGRGTVV